MRGDAWMRDVLHAHYRSVFRAGDRVVDVGCGTGIDTIALARMGAQVVAIDGSSAMVSRCERKIAEAGLASLASARVLAIEELSTLAEAPFDGAVSAFASLSSLPELHTFARDATRLVRPGGRMVLHLLNGLSSWEYLGCIRRGDWRAAAAVGRQRTRRFVIGGHSVEHRLYFWREAYVLFEAGFTCRAAFGLGMFRPPHTVRRVPAPIVSALEWLDVRAGRWPLLRDTGRFFVLDLERRPT